MALFRSKITCFDSGEFCDIFQIDKNKYWKLILTKQFNLCILLRLCVNFGSSLKLEFIKITGQSPPIWRRKVRTLFIFLN